MTVKSNKISHRLSEAVEKMPAFPKSVRRILDMTRNINCSPKELVSVIEKDPVMTMKLLRVLNSAYYSLPNKISSINQSVVYLGVNTVKNMALSFAIMGVLHQKKITGFDNQSYLMHSLTTASLARMLCQKFFNDETDPNDCYMAGLLHDFGKIVFAQFFPEEFGKVLSSNDMQVCSLHITESQILGADHAIVGAMLLEKWQFPQFLSDAIRYHHDPIPADNTLLSCLFAANQISKKLSMGHSGNLFIEEFSPELRNRFGGSMDDIIVRLGDLSMMLEEAKDFMIEKNISKFPDFQAEDRSVSTKGETLPLASKIEHEDDTVPTLDAQIIDLSILAKSVGNSPELIYELTTEFLVSAQQGLSNLDAAIVSGDIEALTMLGYRLRSSAGAVGAIGFADLCYELVQCGGDRNIELARNIVARLHPMLEKIKKSLGNTYANMNTPK